MKFSKYDFKIYFLQIMDELIGNSNLSQSFNTSEENIYDVPTSLVVILSLFYGLISLTAFIGNSLGQSKSTNIKGQFFFRMEKSYL